MYYSKDLIGSARQTDNMKAMGYDTSFFDANSQINDENNEVLQCCKEHKFFKRIS